MSRLIHAQESCRSCQSKSPWYQLNSPTPSSPLHSPLPSSRLFPPSAFRQANTSIPWGRSMNTHSCVLRPLDLSLSFQEQSPSSVTIPVSSPPSYPPDYVISHNLYQVVVHK